MDWKDAVKELPKDGHTVICWGNGWRSDIDKNFEEDRNMEYYICDYTEKPDKYEHSWNVFGGTHYQCWLNNVVYWAELPHPPK